MKIGEVRRHIRISRKLIEYKNEAMMKLFEEGKYMAGSWI